MRVLLCALAGALVVCAPAGAKTDVAAHLGLGWPAEGTVTSPFGDGRNHPGIDIGILRSPTVRAAAPGIVTLVGQLTGYEGYGTIVQVDVGGGYATIYAHLASTRVHPGDVVEAGHVLGVAGCTGWCTGTHLHFELRQE